MSRHTRFRLVEDGRWSGGGDVLLENAREARASLPILQGGSDAVPIIPRNVPRLGQYPRVAFVAIPQNAWVWTPVARGLKEQALLTGLRIGTRVTYNRASAVIRISEAVPAASSAPTSPVIHNVLDRGFEAALAQHNDHAGAISSGSFVCVGSNYSFRDLNLLVRAHAVYRAMGGSRRLVLMGPVGSRTSEVALQAELRRAGGGVVRRPASTRGECLSALRTAYAVVCPARVEASPIGVLEAAVLSPRVLLSDISGHQGIVRSLGGVGEPAYFTPHDVTSLAEQLAVLDDVPAHTWQSGIDSVSARQAARDSWGQRLGGFLQGLAETINPQGDKELA